MQTIQTLKHSKQNRRQAVPLLLVNQRLYLTELVVFKDQKTIISTTNKFIFLPTPQPTKFIKWIIESIIRKSENRSTDSGRHANPLGKGDIRFCSTCIAFACIVQKPQWNNFETTSIATLSVSWIMYVKVQ